MRPVGNVPAPGRGSSVTMQLTSGGDSDSEDRASEDSDEAETRKLRMFDGMSVEDLERMMHPDYVAKRESLNRKVEEMERHQNYVKWNASEIPVVSADAIQNHLKAIHGSPEEAPPTEMCSNGFSEEDAEEGQPWTKYDVCHTSMQSYDKEIQSTTVDMWKEYEEWEKAAENQGLRDLRSGKRR